MKSTRARHGMVLVFGHRHTTGIVAPSASRTQ